jgi:alpha-ketoglutarate-dependent taurine dioxygenase
MGLTVTKLSPFGARIDGTDAEFLLSDAVSPEEILDLLDENGVLVFPELGLDDAHLVAFSRRFGDLVAKKTGGAGAGRNGEFPEVFTVSLDPRLNDGPYMKTTVEWHIDGTTNEIPSKASLLTARALDPDGGHTQFVNTYTAYDNLTDDEKQRFASAKVVHNVESAFRKFDPNPTPEVVERLRKEATRVHPLVWTHRSGRKSLVLGNTTDHIVGMDRQESDRVLSDLLDRAGAPEHVLTHHWKIGDLVIWDNRGCLHRATPYDPKSGREMHRVTLVGDEAIV